jgi:hypothetical protein
MPSIKERKRIILKNSLIDNKKQNIYKVIEKYKTQQ